MNLAILLNYSYLNEYLVIPPPPVIDPLEWALQAF
jgi:hypothetical protein